MQEVVFHALELKATNGSDESYQQLILELQTCTSSKQVQQLFQSLASHAAYIAENHNSFTELLSMLFQFDWSIDDADILIAFNGILCSLVSSNSGFLQPVFQLCIKSLIANLDENENENDDGDVEMKTESNTEDRSYMDLINNTKNTLLPVLISTFPHKSQSVLVQQIYVHNMLLICDYVPVLRDRIMALIVDRLLLIDVEIRVSELPPMARSTSDETGMFEMDNEQQNGDKLAAPTETSVLAHKLDLLLCILFDYIDKKTQHKKSARAFFDLLLNIFDRSILPTNHCKFTQFCIFYVCRKHTEFVEIFVETLLQHALNDDEPMELKLLSIGYLGSFLARASYIKTTSLLCSLRYMVDYLHSYINKFNAEQQNYFHPKQHMQFYGICQAAVYITIFKGRELKLDVLRQMKWDDVVDCSLKPFVYFNADILDEFIKFALEFNLLSPTSSSQLQQLHGSSKMSSLAGSNGKRIKGHITDKGEIEFQLSLLFPFDPCMLVNVNERIAPSYSFWYSSKGHDSDTDSDASTASSEEDAALVEFSDKHLKMVKASNGKLPSTTPVRIPVNIHRKKSSMLAALGAFSASQHSGATLNWSTNLVGSMSPSSLDYAERGMANSGESNSYSLMAFSQTISQKHVVENGDGSW